MLDNRLVQIALFFLAFYVILQMVNGPTAQEHLDAEVSIAAAPGTQTTVSVQPSPALSNTVPAPANSLVTPELAAASSTASAVPVVTSAPSAAISTTVPSPLTSVEETLIAAAPQVLPQDQRAGLQNANIFAPEPTDLEAMFGRRGYVEPADLIPKTTDAELYAGLVPDPNLNQNFLQNPWSMGIDTSIGKFNAIQDLRGLPYPPTLSIVSPWQNPTKFPDLYRKSWNDVT